jgi:hypothetical protein
MMLINESPAAAQAYLNGGCADVSSADGFDFDRYITPLDKEWRRWSRTIDDYLRSDLEQRIRALPEPIGRIPSDAKLWFLVANGKVVCAMVEKSSFNEKFDALAVESAKSMSGKFLLLFPIASRRHSVGKRAILEPIMANAEECTGKSWTKFMDGSCEFYVYKNSDKSKEKEMERQITQLNSSIEKRRSHKDFMTVESISDVLPNPDPDEGYGYKWWRWSLALDDEIYSAVSKRCGQDGVKKPDIPLPCKVSFVVSNQGKVRNITLRKSSSNPKFDQIVLDEITSRLEKPLNPFPSFSKRTSVTKTIEIDLAFPPPYWAAKYSFY